MLVEEDSPVVYDESVLKSVTVREHRMIEVLFHGCDTGFMAVAFLDEPGSPVLYFLCLILMPFSVGSQATEAFSKCGQIREVYAWRLVFSGAVERPVSSDEAKSRTCLFDNIVNVASQERLPMVVTSTYGCSDFVHRAEHAIL